MTDRKPLHAMYVTFEGWGDTDDFVQILDDVPANDGRQRFPLRQEILDGVQEGGAYDETIYGNSVSRYIKEHGGPLYVYELRLVGKYDYKEIEPPPPPIPEHEWIRRAVTS